MEENEETISMQRLENLFNKEKDESYSKWALKTTRNWTNAQLVAVKAAISLLLTNAAWEQVKNQGESSIDFGGYLLIAVLVTILYLVFRFENMNNKVEDKREEETRRLEQTKVAQILALHYMFNKLLPEIEEDQKRLNILKVIPQMMAYIDADQVTKEVSTGFSLVADVTTTILSKIDGMREDIRQSLDVDKLLANMEDVPKPKKVGMKDLTPSDPRFPQS